MDLFFLVLGVVFLTATLIRLRTDWAPWPLRMSIWPLRLDVSEEKKKKEAERLTAVVFFSIGAIFFLAIGTGLLD